MVTTPLSTATHGEITAPPPIFRQRKMCGPAALCQLLRVSDLKPHVHEESDL